MTFYIGLLVIFGTISFLFSREVFKPPKQLPSNKLTFKIDNNLFTISSKETSSGKKDD